MGANYLNLLNTEASRPRFGPQLHTFYEGDTRDLSTLSSQLGAPQSAFEARAFDVSAPRRGSVPGVSPHRRALDLVLSLSYDRCTPRSTISALPCHRCRDRTVTGKGSTRPRWPKTACVPPGGSPIGSGIYIVTPRPRDFLGFSYTDGV